jgi:hypothetical protein
MTMFSVFRKTNCGLGRSFVARISSKVPQRQLPEGLLSKIEAFRNIAFIGALEESAHYVPSAKNTIGNMLTYSVVKLDWGCMSILQPLRNKEEIDILAAQFPPGKYYWEMCTSVGVGRKTYVLKIMSGVANELSLSIFPVCLGEDLFGQTTCKIPFMRFFLASEHLDYLLSKGIKSVEKCKHYKDACVFSKTHTEVILPRKYLLLGQSVLSKFLHIGTPDGTMYMGNKAPLAAFETWENVSQMLAAAVATAETSGSFDRAAVRRLKESSRMTGDAIDETIDHTVWSDEVDVDGKVLPISEQGYDEEEEDE